MSVRYNVTIKKGFDFNAVKREVEKLGVRVDKQVDSSAIRFITGTGRQGLESRMRLIEGVSRAAPNREAELADG